MSIADDVVKELHATIVKTLEAFKGELSTVRTGRASLHMLDGVRVDYYGNPPLCRQPGGHALGAQAAHDRGEAMGERTSSRSSRRPSATPTSASTRCPTRTGADSRPGPHRGAAPRDRQDGEAQGRGVQGVDPQRTARAKELLDAAEKDGDCSADEVKKAQEKVQKETDDGVKGIDLILAAKEKDVMQV